jgi:hypothetical protein
MILIVHTFLVCKNQTTNATCHTVIDCLFICL